MDRHSLRQLRAALIDPLTRRLSSMVARAVVQLVTDSGDLQRVQIGVLDGEVIDDAERFQQYGFSSVPLTGAEAVVLFPGGDRAHPLVIAADDRRHRPTGLADGEVAIYAESGASVVIKASGDIEATPASGQKLLVSTGGATEPVVLLSEFEAHVHATGVGPSDTPTAPISGSQALETE